ncbi:MAG: hypothetical protein ACMVO3_22610 [Thalassobaculum sp.]
MNDRDKAEIGERIRALEVSTQINAENVAKRLEDGTRGFEKIRESLDNLSQVVATSHAGCAKHEDLHAHDQRIEKLEKFRARTQRYGGIVGALGAIIVGAITLFGPARVAEAWITFWKS